MIEIRIDMEAKCAECGKGGALASGICLACTTKTLKGKPMKSAVGRAVADRNMRLLAELRSKQSKDTP
jgi:hypothetical protein